MWDVHGGYTDALLHAGHTFCFLRDVESGSAGLARLGDRRPPNACEVTVAELRDAPPDLVLVQRLEEIQACGRIFGRQPGGHPAAVFLEHNTPKGAVPDTRHPLADQTGWLLVHVTHFNRLMWDCGRSATVVVEHGLPDPGHRYTGELASLAFVVNEPVRRWRTTGTDLLTHFADHAVDAFGIDGDLLPPALAPRCPRLRFSGNLAPGELSAALARRRAYLHLNRWTSLGLSLIHAMLLGVPVIVLDTTEASRAVPVDAGARSLEMADLVGAADRLLADHDLAVECGRRARTAALWRYDHSRFLQDWEAVFAEAASRTRAPVATAFSAAS